MGRAGEVEVLSLRDRRIRAQSCEWMKKRRERNRKKEDVVEVFDSSDIQGRSCRRCWVTSLHPAVPVRVILPLWDPLILFRGSDDSR